MNNGRDREQLKEKENEKETEEDCRPQQDHNRADVGGVHAPEKRQQKGRWRATGFIISINSKSRCSGSEISHSSSLSLSMTNPGLTADACGAGIRASEGWRGCRWSRRRGN